MNTYDEKTAAGAATRTLDRNARAAEVLRRLDEIGAIKLDVLISKSAEIQQIAGVSELDPEDRMCYPFMIRVGPRHDLDLVSVATELRQLGFDLKRVNKA